MFRILKIYKNSRLDFDSFLRTLFEFGYEKKDKVFTEGEFAIRGQIIDVFPITFENPIRLELDLDSVKRISSFSIKNHDINFEHDVVIILPRRLKEKKLGLDVPINNFIDLNIGDYIVHVDYGIGKYLGRQKIKVGDEYKEVLVLEYDNKEKIYLPQNKINLIQKYIGFGGIRPRLYKLGTKNWLKAKQKVKKGILKFARELLEFAAKRKTLTGFKYSSDTEWQEDFEKTFSFQETPDQINSLTQVKADMESVYPMDRLLCGDVGYGKTEVAMRASFKAVMDNKQVAILVPTTILAQQHYLNFKERLKNFPVNVELLCRFRTVAEQKAIMRELMAGSIDIIIGTHKLLCDDIGFKDLGLLIIDEEQRFGVRAKEKLKHLKINIDILTLTATPIPRTLYQSLMNIKDISIINSPPENRQAIKTFVSGYDDDLIRSAIMKEVKRKGQVFFIHNRVLTIERQKKKIERILPSYVKIVYAHGQMPSSELEKIISDFFKGKIDVLVSTMIVSSGIDIPRANTLIVNNADQFGLSDLHQLRGRVGRFVNQAYAYFLFGENKAISRDAKRRLEAMLEFSELGSGFKIAFQDLEIRGAGNILGLEQHGFISTVGFDLYCRMLREISEELKEGLREK
ncbi:MAG: transcription-repair coupling factor [Candidatus Omnitrophota bacterium]